MARRSKGNTIAFLMGFDGLEKEGINGWNYFDSAPWLWWDTRLDLTCEEAESVELATAGFEMGPARFLVASLCATQDGGDTLQMAFTVFGIKPQRAHQRIGGVADLAQGDQRVFPPAVPRSASPGKDD